MSVTLKTIMGKMRVLSGQSFFVRDEVLLNALGRKIAAYATDAAHVERMIDAWVSRTTEMLRIADVASLAAESVQGGASTLPEPCSACAQYGGSFVIREMDGGSAGRCDCMRGLALRTMDSARARNGLKHSEVA